MSKRNTKRVHLQSLFRWHHELDILGEGGETAEKLYQRVVNEQDFEKARLAAVRKSRQIRMAIRDTNSAEHDSLLEILESYTKEQLINLSLMQHYDEFVEKARESAKTQMPKQPPSDAVMERIENYETAVDNFDEKFADEVARIVTEIIKTERDKLMEKPDEEIKEEAKKGWENQICTGTANEYFQEYLAYLGTYDDPEFRERTFQSYEDFSELAANVKKQIVDGYKKLAISQEELKN